MNDKYAISLYNIFEGYVRNYRRLNIHQASLSSMFTRREIEYFATVGEYLGFFSFVEDSKRQQGERGTHSRPMDLAWWKYDRRGQKGEIYFTQLILHLERENLASKAIDTIEKLFCKSDKDNTPYYVIGIICVNSQSEIPALQDEVEKGNEKQGSEVLMIYRYEDKKNKVDVIEAHFTGFEIDEKNNPRYAILKTDEIDYWTMCFKEEHKGKI